MGIRTADAWKNSAQVRQGDESIERRWGKHTGRGSTKARQFGRIADDDWQAIKTACQRAGMSLTEWAVPTLLEKARREGARKTA